MEFVWIRHGMTEGNRKKKYIGGRTDEGLCKDGREMLLAKKAAGIYPEVEKVYVSPMKRCLETAELLYPDMERQIISGFRECDFGLFENKNAEELSGTLEYQSWINGNGKGAFPEGESPQGFRKRSTDALLQLLREEKLPERSAFVVHGGTIMAVFAEFDQEKKGFYDYHTDNGCGYRCKAVWQNDKLALQGCQPVK